VQNAFSEFPISKIWFQEKFRGGANHFESNDNTAFASESKFAMVLPFGNGSQFPLQPVECPRLLFSPTSAMMIAIGPLSQGEELRLIQVVGCRRDIHDGQAKLQGAKLAGVST
jgi:hypothetical protein